MRADIKAFAKAVDNFLIFALQMSIKHCIIVSTDKITAIELKSVKPNSGEMKGEKQKILEGKAALYRHFPDKQISFQIGFPFDPTVNPAVESPTSVNKSRFLSSIINMNKYFHPDESLVANELWDLLSGQLNTMEQIIEIINTISTTAFPTKFHLITDNAQRLNPLYVQQLTEWNLFSEIELINNNSSILRNIGSDKTKTRIYNKTAFDGKGNYNSERYNILQELI